MTKRHRVCRCSLCLWAGSTILVAFLWWASAPSVSGTPPVPVSAPHPFPGQQGDQGLTTSQSTSQPAAANSARYTGALSCAATACHGLAAVPNIDSRAGSEYVFWLERDPHARAGDALSSPGGLAMLEQLGIVRDGRVVDARGLANCEACHNPRPAEGQRFDSYTASGEGVSCEACHGAAERWRTVHYRPGISRVQLIELGMTDTKDLATRAKLCAGCHVAGRGEVNHDLIAAGHPALKFELSAWHAIYPKHWDGERERQRWPDLDWQLWCFGQRAALEAVARQTLARAQDLQRPWPELAEWDCYACHHDLSWPSWRQERGYSSRRPGAMFWNLWYRRWVSLSYPPDEQGKAVDGLIDQLAELFAQKTVPDRQQVAQQSKELVDALAQMPHQLPDRAAVAAVLRSRLVSGETSQLPVDKEEWDSCAQLYLMLRAYAGTKSNSDGGSEQPAQALRILHQALAFDPGQNSPGSFDAVQEDVAVRRRQVRAQVEALVRSLLTDAEVSR
ncbi:MAG: hypothetical protein KatS3mg110_0805 [Pirellulaceae bacterium]|nr:MAG: hypothetical protein KatS3mg110_0805 [Pirellulaceae bacterium]